jgi:hypothetical protein
MVRTLERPPNLDDAHNAACDGDAEFQLKPDFHMPAVSKWVEHNGDRLYSGLDKLKYWDERDAHGKMLQFEQPLQRWEFWQKSLLEVTDGDAIDEVTRDEARSIVRRMRKISTERARLPQPQTARMR